MITQERSEAAGALTPTASGKSDNPVDQTKNSNPPENVDNPSPEDKSEGAVHFADGDDDKVTVQQGSNPVAAVNDDSGVPEPVIPTADVRKSASGVEGAPHVAPTKKKRGRKPGSRNREKKEKPTAGQPAKNGTQQAPLDSEAKPAAVQTSLPADQAVGSNNMRWVPAVNIIADPLFSALFPIDEETRDAIEADMRANGFDPAHALQVWEYQGKLYLVDGYTRKDAAERAGITEWPVYMRHFSSREDAFTFAVKAQTVRRNLHDGHYLNLVALCDKKVAIGSDQPRAEDGQFGPKASDDAHGKSASKTAAIIGVSTTKVERIRRVLSKADEVRWLARIP